ncbi:MAG: hypothetical protein ACOX8N_08615 [Christensenellales bacterium]|jgi:hypothetical protein
MKEMKYVQFLQTINFPRERLKYYKDVKYRVVEETDDKYVISKRHNIAIRKEDEGRQYITGRI